MPNDTCLDITGLSDAQLLAGARGLARQERRLTAELVAHLAELDRRGVLLHEGYSCLFVYCRDALGMSEGEAYNRSKVAEAARRCPAVLHALLEGDVTLTVVRLVAPHLTPENCDGVLASVRGRTKAQIEEVVAALAPRPDARSAVRRLPQKQPRQAAFPTGTGVASSEPTSPAPPVLRPAPPVVPTAPDRYRVQVTVDREAVEMLRRLQDLLRHALPSGDEAEIVKRALAALLVQVEKQKFAATTRPRSGSASAQPSRHVGAEVKRLVWQRDDGRCAYLAPSGHRCAERSFLEFHHRHPHALGGAPTAENLQLRCRPHNQYEAQVDFGFDRWDGAGRRANGPGPDVR